MAHLHLMRKHHGLEKTLFQIRGGIATGWFYTQTLPARYTIGTEYFIIMGIFIP